MAGRQRHASVALLAAGALMSGLAVVAAVPAQAAADAPEYSATRTLIRTHVAADGGDEEVDSRTVTVTVDTTQNLRGRERVLLSWSGARPSSGRSISPYGISGINQEYPVVVLQCRGLDDPSLPAAEQVQPETCWSTTYTQRYAAMDESQAVWQHDRYAPAADVINPPAASFPTGCTWLPFASHLLPFRAADGTVFPSCSESTIPPESSVDSALPAAEMTAFTQLDGTGSAQFEVRTETENESLGCSSTVACSLVVIPIMGISCADADAQCRKENSFDPGSTNDSTDGQAGASGSVTGRYWWSASNWRNRFSVPLTFALPPDTCDVLDARPPVQVNGSELLNQASLQWAPAYCLRADRFKLRHNRMSESQALRLLDTGEGLAAFVSDAATASSAPLGYAPTAVSGFAVGYVIDLPDNAGELTTLKLTPRLLAKLLTLSYPALPNSGHTGIEGNPINLLVDPEFTDLNPGLSTITQEAAATILSLSFPSDVTSALTAYIAADEEAMDFMRGEKDPWGMVVNPVYQDQPLPVADWPLLDSWVKPSQDSCESQITTPYGNRLAAPVSSITKVAEAVLDAWPNVQTKCTGGTASMPLKVGRLDRQPFGSRVMLGIVSLGDAERYGLRTAALRTSGTGTSATFVLPSNPSMAAALTAASQTVPGGVFTLDRDALPADAYPGTMVIHTAAKLTGLDAADARRITQLIEVATTEGQIVGSANGELPDGYLPITATGPTAALHASAQVVAAAIAQQSGPITVPATPGPPPPTSISGALTVGAGATSGAPASTAPGLADASGPVDGLPADAPPGTADAAPATTTMVQRSTAAGAAIPAALGMVLAGAAGAPLLRSLSTRKRA